MNVKARKLQQQRSLDTVMNTKVKKPSERIALPFTKRPRFFVDKLPKTTPPFTKLPSYNCAAIILSFLDFDETIYHLMSILSMNAAIYIESHK